MILNTREQLERKLTELEQLYQANQRLHKERLQSVVTDERNRLAREIHDVLAQGLMAIKLQVEAAQLSSHDQDALTKRLQQIAELTQQNLQEARRAMANLRPLPLEGQTLVEALESKVVRFGLEFGIETTFTTSGDVKSFPTETEAALYRVAQEALSNAARHSKALQISLSLDYDEDEVCLTVSDDGQGFETWMDQSLKTVSNTNGFGLTMMQERAQQVGGWLAVQSSPGTGSRIRMIVPYRHIATKANFDSYSTSDLL